MSELSPFSRSLPGAKLFNWAFDYWRDAGERWLLYQDVLRQRGNNYLEHLREGQPPVLIFDYEMVMDGRDLPNPVNYALVRIVDRRQGGDDRRHLRAAEGPDGEGAGGEHHERRAHHIKRKPGPVSSRARPIVVIDPRAGHGPGIGGMKQESQIGMALDKGHPVYFILFYPKPVAGQTLADVKNAQALFIEKVAALHPKAQQPTVIGNCQAGWAVALLAADRPDLVGSMVLNGSPLSYWAGTAGKDMMRYRGGLLGGIWLTSLVSDLGGGSFDGAHLVAGFEDMNPANTLWEKDYHLYSNVDTEANRYLEFERWWTGFFDISSEEIHFIVKNLFIGNLLENGEVSLEERKIDLRNLDDPIVVFASAGDNITPPQQALNWIFKVWSSLEELQLQGQKIVYLLHEDVGHLGIFVSGKVVRREHAGILGNICLIDELPPGLYEMVIRDAGRKADIDDYSISFEKRDFDDLRALGGGKESEKPFRSVAVVSEINDELYHRFASPWVRRFTNRYTSEAIRQLHPLRFSRYFSSDLNPLYRPLKRIAPLVRNSRHKVRPENPFLALEHTMSKGIANFLDNYREARDRYLEFQFRALYENPLWNSFLPEEGDHAAAAKERTARDKKTARALAKVGGFPEAVARVMIALAEAREVIHPVNLRLYAEIAEEIEELSSLDRDAFREIVKTQSAVFFTDPELALSTLRKLVPAEKDARALYVMALRLSQCHGAMLEADRKVLEQIRVSLAIADTPELLQCSIRAHPETKGK